MTDKQASEIGQAIIEALGLKVTNGRVATTWGTKTPMGVGYMVEAIIAEKTVQRTPDYSVGE